MLFSYVLGIFRDSLHGRAIVRVRADSWVARQFQIALQIPNLTVDSESHDPFTTGNPFLGTNLLGFSIGRGSGALKGLVS